MTATPTLDGITVLDLSSVGPASRCSRVLADYGADVIKVGPPPRKGDVQIQCTRKKLKAVNEYFTEDRDRADVFSPLYVTGTKGRFDILVRCNGGGYMGQAQAVRLGIARALRDYDPSLEDALRDAGFLSRDARKVERKKPGQPGARRRFQFSKR